MTSKREFPITLTDEPGRYDGKTGDEWRALAAEARKRSADSWERSDTDGFLSQWAADTIAREYDAKSKVADHGGTAEFRAVFNLDGTVASVDYRDGQYGPYWLLNDRAAALYGKRFFKESEARTFATRKRNNARKGFTIGTVRMRAYVTLAGSSSNIGVSVRPHRDAIRNAEYVIVSRDSDGAHNDW